MAEFDLSVIMCLLNSVAMYILGTSRWQLVNLDLSAKLVLKWCICMCVCHRVYQCWRKNKSGYDVCQWQWTTMAWNYQDCHPGMPELHIHKYMYSSVCISICWLIQLCFICLDCITPKVIRIVIYIPTTLSYKYFDENSLWVCNW